MCGLAGGVALRDGARPDLGRVRRMSAAVAHRGPDDDGFWVSPSGAACLAHRRLSIIDLATGHQPLLGRGGSTGLIFNGEIYNYLELREELVGLGSRFKTESDTEVLQELLLRDGDRALDRVVGMFAFAFWDDESRRLLLVRDRVGKKPLYHVVIDGCLYFCSTLRGLEAVLPADLDVDTTSVWNFLNLGYVPAPDTILRGVSKLAAATVLEAGPDHPVRTARYWEPAVPSAPPIQPGDALGQFARLVEDAVRIRLRSDVPLGVFLSGGIDSSLVTAVASRLSAKPIQTFTVGFNVAEFDEAARARRIAKHLGTEHHEFQVDTDVLDLLPKLVHHFGEPFADPSALPVWRLAEAARSRITVALMGDGGDEGFAGYEWYRTAHRLGRLQRAPGGGWLAGAAEFAARPLGVKARRLAYLLAADPAERFVQLRCMFGRHATTPPLFRPGLLEGLDADRLATARIEEFFRRPGLRELHAMQYADLRSYLPGDLLPKVDVCTMAHSLEARAPLLDHRILEFAFRLPPSAHRVQRPKALMRELLTRYLPAELTRGPKRGFTVPLASWFRGELRPMVEAIPDGRLSATGWVDPAAMRNLVEDHVLGRRDNSIRLYHLLALEMWLDR